MVVARQRQASCSTLKTGGPIVAEQATRRILIRVPPAMGDRLQQLADEENNRISVVTRRLLTRALNQESEETGCLSVPTKGHRARRP
jgi:hypothetical protein